jgi:hypothetical protein
VRLSVRGFAGRGFADDSSIRPMKGAKPPTNDAPPVSLNRRFRPEHQAATGTFGRKEQRAQPG